MPVINLLTLIDAPPARCFELSRDLDLHRHSMVASGERAIGGRITGLIELDEEVTWEARHFGVLHRHTSRITALTAPTHFRDEMIHGRFRYFVHDHFFSPTDAGGTVMRDVLLFASPWRPLGWVVDAVVMTRYLRRLLEQRNACLKAAAERPA